MTELLALRDYQREAIDNTFDAIARGITRPAVVLPTGAGKTVIFSHMAKEWRDTYPDKRVLILVHRDELVTQTVKKLNSVAPGLKVGVVKAERNEIGADVVVASVQTIRSFARCSQIKNVGLIIIDEAHHASADSYRFVLNHFGAMVAECPSVGFSATLVRSDQGDLSDVWQRVVCQRDILDMIPEYLCDVRGKLVTVDGLSLSEVSVNRGDLATGSLTDALLTAEAQNFVVRAYFEHASDRPTIVFTPTVLATQAFTEAFAEAGVRVGAIWGAMPAEDRVLTLKRFGDGDLDVIVNCMVLTEGFDEPRASCAIIARPTRSAALYVQMVGRVLRRFPGKTDALVLDVVGASLDHKLATLADLTSKRIKEILPGETLAEAAIREKKEGNPNLAGYVVDMEDVDLFHRSPSMWLTTYEGVYFIQTRCTALPSNKCMRTNSYGKCGTHIWFLWPDENGTYKVGVRATYKAGGMYVREGLDLETAMSWAEQYATEEDPSLANRNASWRRRKQLASEPQKDYARGRGLQFPDNISKRDLSNMLSIDVASSKLDKAFKKVKENAK